jgi:hypothetical protein
MDGRSPDDLRDPNESRRVDYVVTIGGKLFAFEHTGIEPFLDQIKFEVDSDGLFGPVIAQFDYRSDVEFWELYVPVDATAGLARNKVAQVQITLSAWIHANAENVPVVRYGDRFGNPVMGENVADVPFRFSLHRMNFPKETALSGRLVLRPVVVGDLAMARQHRLRNACEKKFPKLAEWKRNDGAHTILVLEENDISLTNPQLVTDAMFLAETGMADIPDEVFLVSTAFKKWTVSCLRRPGATYYDEDERFHDFDPGTLSQLTKR